MHSFLCDYSRVSIDATLLLMRVFLESNDLLDLFFIFTIIIKVAYGEEGTLLP